MGDYNKPEYDLFFTDKVIAATGPKANPRLKQIMPSLLRHLHDFAREVDLTVAEWMAGVELINEAGRMSTDKRNETGLVCDVLGLESLVDEITSKQFNEQAASEQVNSAAAGLDGQADDDNDDDDDGTATTTAPRKEAATAAATPAAILGPFYRANAPLLPNGGSIVYAARDSGWYAEAAPLLARVSGRVLSSRTGAPVPGAVVDVWHAGPNGLYEQQDDSAPDMNLRGRFRADGAGRYALGCLRPTAYPIPDDGPAGRLLKLLDRHPYRPAHIHFVVSAPGFRSLTTQVFDREDRFVRDDAVFAVKEELLVEFREREREKERIAVDGDEDGYDEMEGARWELEYDFHLRDL
ncbi:aromatic compound dioxygenase [Xylariomycetidae sp. FL2044]|nr:aromatic compound dioxygenase [Xylariomycetidae sp. FL2044]